MNKYQQLVKEQDKRLKKLEDELSNLYFLTEEEIQRVLGKFENLPAKAFDEMHELLKDAKKKQNRFMIKAVILNNKFPKVMDKAIHKKYVELNRDIAKKESQNIK
ncbi:hypothetical protein ACFL10_01400 [Patescibacteria group bacterium]